MSAKSQNLISLNDKYGAHNYHPLPVVLNRAKGPFVWDVDGRKYFDFLSAYSALNQGHLHPAIVAAAKAQLNKMSLSSRAFHNDRLGPFLKFLCDTLGFDRALMMNSGAEAVETAIKAMRLWGYRVKGVDQDRAEIIVCDQNFHGRTTTIVGFSSDSESSDGFGPATPGFVRIPFGDEEALKRAINANTVGFLFEPVQGEAGVIIPPPGYLKKVRKLCSTYRVLMCADEIQTGLGRAGSMLVTDKEDCHADLVLIGKALSGGLYPISAVLGSDAVLNLFTPGTHGSTFGGNPLACAIAEASLKVILKEKLPQKAAKMGTYFLAKLKTLQHPHLLEARGIGLMMALEFTVPVRPLVLELMKKGLLAKDTHQNTIRFAPPLNLTQSQADMAFKIIQDAVATFPG